MRADIETSINESMTTFRDVVWPKIEHILGGGRLVAVEGATTDALRLDLDRLAGIDAWHMIDHVGTMRGIASRVQWDTNYRSFTVRAGLPSGNRTEIHKRLHAIRNQDKGYLYPHLTIQAYVTKASGRLIGAGIIKTTDLYEYIENNPIPRLIRNPQDGHLFAAYFWKDLRAQGYVVHEWEGPQSRLLVKGKEVAA